MTASKIGAGRKPAPLTTAQKQSRRRAALDVIAQLHGWSSWDQYSTAVKNGRVEIVDRIIDNNTAPRASKLERKQKEKAK